MCEYFTVHHSPLDGHLECFQFWAVMTNASKTSLVQVFLWIYALFLLGKYEGKTLLFMG